MKPIYLRNLSRNIFLALVLVIILNFFLTIPALAENQDVLKTATASISAEMEAKIKSLQQEIASKAADLKQEISKRLQNKAYIGPISTKTDSQITLQGPHSPQNINFNEFTILTGIGIPVNTTFKTSSNLIKVGDYIAALGDADENAVLTAKKIFKLDPTQVELRRVIIGTITEKTVKSITIKSKDSQDIVLHLTKSTTIQSSDNNGSVDDLKVNSGVIAVGSFLASDKETIQARFIDIIPTPLTINQQSASPSAN